MSTRVELTAEAKKNFRQLPVSIRARVLKVFERLQEWPAVSGAKPLRGDMAGHYRIRTGDWRIVFEVKDNVIVVRFAHRRDVYED